MENKQYKNRDWLYKKYWEEDLSVNQIANICEINYESLREWMIKFDISRRGRSEAVHLRGKNSCRLSQEAINWINGELLGDGCLRSESSYSARFGYSSKYLEYIEYVSDTLKSFGIEQSGKIYKNYHKKYNCYTYQYQSIAYVELLPIYLKWYPEGKKIIPKDIELTPITLRQHYIGDGSLEHQRHARPRITLATDGFTISDVKWLVEYLIRLGFKTVRWPTRNRISISAYSTKDFLRYIGNCPIECYQYKWAY